MYADISCIMSDINMWMEKNASYRTDLRESYDLSYSLINRHSREQASASPRINYHVSVSFQADML